MLAALDAACCAANGVPLRDPRKPSEPELFHDNTLPDISVIVTIVLLKEACTCTSPCGTCLRSFFLNVFFLPFLSGAAAPPAAAGFAIEPQVSRFPSFRGSRSKHRNLEAFETVKRFPMFSMSPSSWWRPFPYAGLCEYARWYECAVRGRASSGDDGTRDRSRFR